MLRAASNELRRRPGVALLAAVVFAAAFWPSILLLGLVDSAFLEPLGVADPGRLVVVQGKDGRHPGVLPHSFPNFADLRQRQSCFDGVAASRTFGAFLAGDGAPEFIFGRFVSDGYLQLLGARMALGSGELAPEGTDPGASEQVVISHRFWQRRFGGDPAALGKTLELNHRQFRIVGVSAPGFDDLNRVTVTEFWLPMSLFPTFSRLGAFFGDRDWRIFDVVARLKAGVDRAGAERELAGISAQLRREHPQVNETAELVVAPVSVAELGTFDRPALRRGALQMLGVSTLLVLLAAVGAGMLLALPHPSAASGRAAARWLQATALALLGGAFGLLAALVTRGTIWALRPVTIPPQTRVDLDPSVRVLAVLTVAILLAGTLAAAVSNWLETRRAAGRPAGLPWPLLGTTGVQVVLAVAAIAGAAILLRSQWAYEALPLGHRVDRVVVMSIDVGSQGYDEARGRVFFRDALERAAAVPRVESVGLGADRPLNFAGAFPEVKREGAPDGEPALAARRNTVTPGFFSTLEIPIVAGRPLTEEDTRDSTRVAVINQTLAARLWPGEEAVGRRFQVVGSPQPLTVAGVARDAKYRDLDEAPQPYFYLPLGQFWERRMNLYARVQGDGKAGLDTLAAAVQTLDPRLHIVERMSLAEIYNGSLWRPRLLARVSGIFALVTTLLAGVAVAAWWAGRSRSR
ncbi:MAG TPA: ABC transporter permease [Thermoanaerobaculia bacterium]|nr:ABC transporter permease [Thermoanaerobaculia bacterium]